MRVVIGEDEALLRTGLSHVLEAGGFEVVAAVAHRALVRQKAFFHAHQVDVRELESLRAVQGHQGDGVLLAIVFLLFVARGERRFLEVAEQRR